MIKKAGASGVCLSFPVRSGRQGHPWVRREVGMVSERWARGVSTGERPREVDFAPPGATAGSPRGQDHCWHGERER